MTTILPDLESIHFDHNRYLLYGASQQMYPTIIKRRAGCGPTTASNMFLYVHQTNPDYGQIIDAPFVNKETALETMETVWNYITPGFWGVNKTEMLAAGAKRYLDERGIPLSPVVLDIPKAFSQRPSDADVELFLERSLRDGVPVAFLVLDAGKVKNMYNWHWILLVGLSSEDGTLRAVVYDEGVKKTVDLSLWLATTRNDGGFVSLAKKGSNT